VDASFKGGVHSINKIYVFWVYDPNYYRYLAIGTTLRRPAVSGQRLSCQTPNLNYRQFYLILQLMIKQALFARGGTYVFC